LSIIAALAVPSYLGYVEKTEREVCYTNSFELERMYSGYLILEDVVHTDFRFKQFIREYFAETCPTGGEISFFNGKVHCS
jgi:hypothetical protein